MICAILINNCLGAAHWPYLSSQRAPIMSWSKTSFSCLSACHTANLCQVLAWIMTCS